MPLVTDLLCHAAKKHLFIGYKDRGKLSTILIHIIFLVFTFPTTSESIKNGIRCKRERNQRQPETCKLKTHWNQRLISCGGGAR
jgi:hypothetical protein